MAFLHRLLPGHRNKAEVTRRFRPRRDRRPAALRFEPLEGRAMLSGNGADSPIGDAILVVEPQTSDPAAPQLPHGLASGTSLVMPSTKHAGPGLPLRSQDLESSAPAWLRELAERMVAEVVGQWRHRLGQPAYERDWSRIVLCGLDFPVTMPQTIPWPGGLPALMLSTAARFQTATHSQVAGVDEADLVETDGELVYVLGHGRLSILAGCGSGVPKLLGQIDVSAAGQPLGMYLDHGRITVVTRAAGDESSGTVVTVVDVTNPSAACIVTRISFDGKLVTSRMVDGRLCVVLQHDAQFRRLQDWLWAQTPRLVPGDQPDSSAQETAGSTPSGSISWRGSAAWKLVGRYETEQAFTERLHRDLVEILLHEIELPRSHLIDQDGAVISSQPLLDLGQNFELPHRMPQSLCTVTTVDVRAPAPLVGSSACVPLTGEPVAFASGNDLYLFSSATEGSWDEPEMDVTKITSSTDADGHPIARIAATGRVSGSLLNRFSVDVKGNHVRLVMEHVGGWGAGTGVLILEQQGEVLVETGRLAGLAPGEDLHAVRFTDDRVAFVTYATIDPLFVVDVSTPHAPTLLGELKIPGYAEYIQAVGANRLLTIGRDVAAGFPWQDFTSLQVSLFDITDPSHPRLLDRHDLGGGRGTSTPITGDPWRRGDGDPLALGLQADAGVLTIPIETADGSQHVVVIRLDGEAGMISHGLVDHEEPVTRTLFTGDRLVAVSATTVSVHDLNDPPTVLASIQLTPPVDWSSEPPVPTRSEPQAATPPAPKSQPSPATWATIAAEPRRQSNALQPWLRLAAMVQAPVVSPPAAQGAKDGQQPPIHPMLSTDKIVIELIMPRHVEWQPSRTAQALRPVTTASGDPQPEQNCDLGIEWAPLDNFTTSGES